MSQRAAVSIRVATVRTFDILKRTKKKLTKIFRVCFCFPFSYDILLFVVVGGVVVVEGERKEGKKSFP